MLLCSSASPRVAGQNNGECFAGVGTRENYVLVEKGDWPQRRGFLAAVVKFGASGGTGAKSCAGGIQI
jgi:hypothetical protein